MVLRTLKGQEIEYYEFLTAIIRGTHFTTIYSSENEKDWWCLVGVAKGTSVEQVLDLFEHHELLDSCFRLFPAKLNKSFFVEEIYSGQKWGIDSGDLALALPARTWNLLGNILYAKKKHGKTIQFIADDILRDVTLWAPVWVSTLWNLGGYISDAIPCILTRNFAKTTNFTEASQPFENSLQPNHMRGVPFTNILLFSMHTGFWHGLTDTVSCHSNRHECGIGSGLANIKTGSCYKGRHLSG
jgi:hypothetical protein